MTIILGIDPGTKTTGYGLVEKNGKDLRHLRNGIIRLPPQLPLPDRLKVTYHKIEDLIASLKPNAVAIEEIFFAHNARSVLKLGESRGVSILAARNNNIPVYEYSAREIKQAVTGYGNASKGQVQKMVQRLLNIIEEVHEDASDALATALCHCNTAKFTEIIESTGGKGKR